MAREASIEVVLDPQRTIDAAGFTTAVVVDQLRASSVLVAATEAGAARVWPCLEPEDARARKAAEGPETLLGGERGAVRIDGFDLGNSPGEYSPERVAGRSIAYTTTNGTRALLSVADADRVVVGCLANRTAVARALEGRCLLVAAGTEGHVSLEDVLGVGAIIDAMPDLHGLALDDAAQIAVRTWRSLVDHEPVTVLAAMLSARGGMNLEGRFDADLGWCSRVDTHGLVPVFDAATGEITALGA